MAKWSVIRITSEEVEVEAETEQEAILAAACLVAWPVRTVDMEAEKL